ncbi:mobile mystery protein B [Pedobacter sp. SL55]|uniref:mobile mystery protein B n=1 Tax=Pedobacter sp. SL55 TaxID=2995161 RepID=UPI002270357D|nr:mobile mystery protein B [Pedobacter sp. SL55]WAC41159.1 mobile mystery protein B [Pedobacter sp. SL55]
MGLNLQYEYGQTELEQEEVEDLKISSISTKFELDEFEQQNIEEAMLWIMNKKWKVEKIFSEAFIKEVHARMYSNVWKWAGKFRKTEKNIGVAHYKISLDLKHLLDDAIFWIKQQSYPADEIAIRFKHRLVSIHCFANGNGRHSRIMADIIVEKLFGLKPFTWGKNSTENNAETRDTYIKAVKTADNYDIAPLIKFARS